MLNLPEQRTFCLLILQISHGNILLSRPVPCISYADSLGRTVHRMRLRRGKSQFMQVVGCPVQLLLPCVVRDPKLQLLIKLTHSLLFDTIQRKGGYILQSLRLCSPVLHLSPDTYHGNPVIELIMAGNIKAGDVIFCYYLQFPSKFVTEISEFSVFHPVSRGSLDVFMTMPFSHTVLARNQDLHRIKGLGPRL